MACRLLLVLFPESWLCTGTRPQIAAFMGSHLLAGHPQTRDHLIGAHLRLICCLASGNNDGTHVSLLLLRHPSLATVSAFCTGTVTHLQLCRDQIMSVLMCASDHQLESVLICESDHNSAKELQSITARD